MPAALHLSESSCESGQRDTSARVQNNVRETEEKKTVNLSSPVSCCDMQSCYKHNMSVIIIEVASSASAATTSGRKEGHE
jgi:hypothetical protein